MTAPEPERPPEGQPPRRPREKCLGCGFDGPNERQHPDYAHGVIAALTGDVTRLTKERDALLGRLNRARLMLAPEDRP